MYSGSRIHILYLLTMKLAIRSRQVLEKASATGAPLGLDIELKYDLELRAVA
jgi:hypothetical protein